jgi:hypothetical protein
LSSPGHSTRTCRAGPCPEQAICLIAFQQIIEHNQLRRYYKSEQSNFIFTTEKIIWVRILFVMKDVKVYTSEIRI